MDDLCQGLILAVAGLCGSGGLCVFPAPQQIVRAHLKVVRQLDQLFQEDALDVSADIDVMQNMLRADGLAGDAPFKL